MSHSNPTDERSEAERDPAANLRQRAEAQLGASTAAVTSTLTPAEIARLVHELQVHQIELELQNEELHHAQEALEQSRARYFALYDLAPVGYVTLDRAGLVQEANLAAATLLDTARAALAGRALSHFILPEDQAAYYSFRRRLSAAGESQHCELRLAQTREATRWVRLDTRLEPQTDPDTPRCWAILTDITASKESERQLLDAQAQLHRMAGIAALSFWEWNPHTNTMYFPLEWRQQTGYSLDESPRRVGEWAALLHPQDRARMQACLETIAAGQTSPCETHYRLRRKDGDYRWFAARLETILDDAGRLERILNVHQDVTQHKQDEDRALQLAQQDPLTGLPSRGLLEQLATHMLASAKRAETRLAVLFADLDHFKAVNDTYGHAVGDQLLRLVARRLRGVCATPSAPRIWWRGSAATSSSSCWRTSAMPRMRPARRARPSPRCRPLTGSTTWSCMRSRASASASIPLTARPSVS